MLIVVMLSCLGDLLAAPVGSPVLFLAQTLPWLVNESKIESIFQSLEHYYSESCNLIGQLEVN